MLYDPKWEGPSIHGFIGWLETKDPNEEYDYYNCKGGCLLGQYLNLIGWEWNLDGGRGLEFFSTDQAEPLRMATAGYPKTIGAALGRARNELRRLCSTAA